MVAVTLLAVAIVVIATRRRGRRHQAREAWAKERGYGLSRGRTPIRWVVTGTTDGVSWRVEALHQRSSQHSSSIQRETRIQVACPSHGEGVLLGPPLPKVIRSQALSNPLVQLALSAIVGDEAAGLLARAKRFDGSGEFGEQYDVLYTEQSLRDALLTTENMDALEAAARRKPTPVVTWWQDQLTVRVKALLSEPEQLDALIALGLSLHRQRRT